MSRRLTWIKANLWPAAVAACRQRVANGRVAEGQVETLLAAGQDDAAWDLVVTCDPTPGHEALSWLLRRWTDGGIRGEDLAKARDSILAWHKAKARLPAPARDLGRYRTLAALDTALMEAGVDIDAVATGGPVSGKALKQADATRIRAVESIVLLDPTMPGSKGWTIAVPLTMDAARWWGRGTRWCTAARDDDDNAFDSYDKDGPLLVLVGPDGRKWQWHPVTNQLADAADTTLPFNQCPAFVDLPVLYVYAMQQDGMALGSVPEPLRTPELCLAAVQQDSFALQYVPGPMRTPKLCMAAVQQNGRALEYIPEPMRTPELCLAAVQQNGWALEYVPEPLRTPELCLAAVQQNGWALKYIPGPLRTQELCLAAVQQDGMALMYVPESMRTLELCLAAMQQSRWALVHVPEPLRTPELCLTAVQQDGRALGSVPEPLRTPELCVAAVQQNGEALGHVPEPLRTPELCLAAVQQNGKALRHVPEPMWTQELCLAAVQQDGMALMYVPEPMRTPKLCLAATRNKKIPGNAEIQSRRDERLAGPLRTLAGMIADLVNRRTGLQTPEYAVSVNDGASIASFRNRLREHRLTVASHNHALPREAMA